MYNKVQQSTTKFNKVQQSIQTHM